MHKHIGLIVTGLLLILLIGGGIYASTYSVGGALPDAAMPEKASVMEDPQTVAVEEKGMVEEKKDPMKMGSYETYAPEKLARAQTGDVVLFFHASWCPSCRGLSADIEKQKDAIPAGVSILKVDYDAESALKKKYGVTYQHTLVQVSADGTLIKKWSGSPSLRSLVAEIQ